PRARCASASSARSASREAARRTSSCPPRRGGAASTGATRSGPAAKEAKETEELRMRLAPRLVLAFGFVATLSVTGLGYVVREDRRATETRRFDDEVASACRRVVAELERQGES